MWYASQARVDELEKAAKSLPVQKHEHHHVIELAGGVPPELAQNIASLISQAAIRQAPIQTSAEAGGVVTEPAAAEQEQEPPPQE
jgi:hypothetical protein